MWRTASHGGGKLGFKMGAKETVLNKKSIYGLRIKPFPKEFPKMSLWVGTRSLSQTRDWGS